MTSRGQRIQIAKEVHFWRIFKKFTLTKSFCISTLLLSITLQIFKLSPEVARISGLSSSYEKDTVPGEIGIYIYGWMIDVHMRGSK